jgi:aspartyl-tRNA(Asn)/glutamyl-tRNA(Gln) amidotransferase subunit A
MAELALLSLAQAALGLRAASFSATDLVRACLERIAELDPILNAFITLTPEIALEQASQSDAELAAGGDRGPLHGIPIALKDLVDTAGIRTTAASGLYEERVPGEDAEVVRRLRTAGAVVLGKLNLHEFAYGGSGVVSRFGPARNPRSPAHIAGGSSSGSAAAVGAGMCYAAIGSDTSGSIRVPAALSGVVGHKPTYGLVSVRGALPLSPSYDHVGPLARTVEDATLVHQAIAGYDPLDIFSVWPPPAGAERWPPRIGVARPIFCDGLDAEVAAGFEAALTVVAKIAASVADVVLPVDDDRTVFRAESVAVHRRHLERTPERYQPETLRRLQSGVPVTASDYIDKLYDLQRMRRGATALFHDMDVDLIVTPTVPVPAPSFAEIEAAPDRLRPIELLLLRNTRPFNILGTPALSVPCGATGAGLPIGLQITGPPFADGLVLGFGAAFERELARG